MCMHFSTFCKPNCIRFCIPSRIPFPLLSDLRTLGSIRPPTPPHSTCGKPSGSVKSFLPWQKGPGHFCGGIGGTQGTQDANLSRRQDEANVKSDQRTKSL